MKASFNKLLPLVLLAGLITAPGVLAQSLRDADVEARAVLHLLDNWQDAEALRRAEILWAAHPESDLAAFAWGRTLFHQGRYEEARQILLNVVSGATPGSALQRRASHYLELTENTIEATRGFEVFVSRDGIFHILHDPRRDALLVEWAAETLEKAWYEVGYDLGHWPAPPVRVEIYSGAATLGRVSSLTEEAVRTTGTIALCKYNKLMLTSPRSTLRGYGWRDTLAHEYVHLVISQLTGTKVPIWLHEALAKLLERRWRGEPPSGLDPSSQDLLARRLAEDNLLTFDQMHPSMALLPSQEDAATGYAQVHTVAQFMIEEEGRGVLRRLMLAIQRHDDVTDAIAEVMGRSFSDFERDWRRWLDEKELVRLPGDFREEVQLLPEPGSEESVDRMAGVREPRARDFLRLGELLRARDMVEAAIVQYERAESLLGPFHPVLQNAMARSLLDMDRAERALEAVSEVARWHPGFYLTHLHKGEALNRLGRSEEAITPLIEAAGINPFDPRVLRELSRAYRETGDDESADRMAAFASRLQGR